MTEQAHTAAAEHHDEHHAHAVPLWLLFGVFGILCILTVLTVAAIFVDAGALNVWIALGIAFIKAMFVALYFMHLRWDSPLYSIVLGVALLTVILLIGIAMADLTTYEPNVRQYDPNYSPAMP